MKKIALVAGMAIAVAATFTSCGNSNKKSDAGSQKEEDSLAYAMGVMESQQMQMALQQIGVDSTNIDEFLKGVKDGVQSAGDKDKDAYNKGLAIGVSESMRFKQVIYPQLFANDSTKTLPMDKFMEGLKAGMKHKVGAMTPQRAQEVFQRNAQLVQEHYFEKAYGANKKKSDAYMAKVAKMPGVKSLGNGVYYKEVKAGTGKTPTVQDMGWTLALTHMKEGATWEVYIPYDAAYGAQDKGPIKPYSALHFTITLLSVEKNPQAQGAPQQMPVR